MIPRTSHLKINLFIDENSVEDVKEYPKSDRTRGATPQGIFSFLLAAFLSSGCVAAYSPAPPPTNHPASPAAPEAPSPPPSQAFRSENIPPAPAEGTPAQDPHMRHGMMHGGH